MTNKILGPTSPIDLTTLLDLMKRETMYSINCVMIGTIELYNTVTNMASISINFKRAMADGTVLEYPKLDDCPVFILSGGTAQISMPIVKGDQCLVLFNDRNFDNWYLSGDVTVPQDTRCHNIADGIALVGIRNLKTAKLTPLNSICIDGGSKKVSVKNSSTNLKAVIDLIIDAIGTLTFGGYPIDDIPYLGLKGLTGASSKLAQLMDEGAI